MSLKMMGANSAADKETRILELKAYLNTVSTADYNSAIALKKAHVYSFATLITYLNIIKKQYWSTLSETGKINFKIADRESRLIKKANDRAKRKQR